MSWQDVCRDKLDAWYLYSTCIHEAGHAAVTRHLGGSAYWRVFTLADAEYNAETHHRWLGRTWSDAGKLCSRAQRKIGLAGVVAEHLDDEPDAHALCIYSYLDDETISPSLSDWDLMAGYSYRELFETVRLVRKLMPKIRAEVDCFLHDLERSHG